jgi:hypothetical protein
LGAPAAASANDFQTVYNYYKKHGTIKPCVFSNQQLHNAERQTPPDVEQYAPSFLDAVDSAREQSGACAKPQKAAATAPAPAPAPPPTPSTPTAAPPTPSAPAPVPTATVATPPPTTPAPTPPGGAANAPALNTQRVAHTDSAPAAIWILAFLAALVALAGISAAAAWWYGWSPDRWARPLGASFSDFGSRLEDTGREFGEWLRLGH